jgi:aspartate/methionine/tyrosine aminotransferase
MAGASFRAVRLKPPAWDFDLDELRQAIDSRTRVLLLNTPHNPTGKVFSRPELEAIAGLACDRDLVVVTDEVYDRILFDGAAHVPIASLPGMWERTLTINSTGKTFSLTGWKVGYAVGPPWLTDALRSVHQFVTFATSTPFQAAMASALAMARVNGYYDQLARDYEERRAVLHDCLARAGLPVLPSAGSYFLQASFDHLPFEDDVSFCRWMITEIGVTPIPPSAFYMDPATAPRLARFCFAKQLTTLHEAGRRMANMAAQARAVPTGAAVRERA